MLKAARVLVLATVLTGAGLAGAGSAGAGLIAVGLIGMRPAGAEGVPDFVETWSHALRDVGRARRPLVPERRHP